MDTKEQINIKEQAEIYAYKHISTGCFDFDLYKQMLKIITKTYLDAYKKGSEYSNRLTEGRKEQWHDLRKDPTDLPKENGKYIVHIKVSEIRTITDTCDFFNGFFGQYINPTAWCELPMFEE